MNKMQDENRSKVKEVNEALDKFSEIKEALDAMQRIIAVEDVKAKNSYESIPRYFQIR